MTHPDSPYLVCATPRSGSTLLCELLSATGLAGRPEEFFEFLYATNLPRQPREYFDSTVDPEVLELLAPTEPGVPESAEAFDQRLADALRDGTTSNGVFASKMMWGYLLDFLRRLRERESTLEAILPGLRYVHVRRHDKVAQAISLWTAVQTARWREESDETDHAEPVYSHAGIAFLHEQLVNQDQAWLRWFKAREIEPLTVVYEELVEDQPGTVLGLMRDLQIDTHDVSIPEPKMRRQSGGRSREWAERFEAERKAAV